MTVNCDFVEQSKGVHRCSRCRRGWHGEAPQRVCHAVPVTELTPDLPKYVSPIEVVPGNGRGIVIPGGGIYLRSAWVTIRMIRHFGCDLPIELWLLPWESVDSRERFAMELQGVTVRKAESGYCLNESIEKSSWGNRIWLAGWQLKVQSVLQSSFTEVIFIDADCYPVESGWLEKMTAGATFLGDVPESSHLLRYSSCEDIGVKREAPVDSGAFFVSKANASWCQIIGAMCGPDMVRDTFNLFFGDKDLWWISHRLTGTRFTIKERGKLLPKMAGIRHSCGLLHRTGSKFTTGYPANTPQHGTHRLDGDDLTDRFLRSWPPLWMRSERDWELVSGVMELDEYGLSRLGPQRWIVDAGAHIGSFSAAVNRRWPSARILAFEPDSINASLAEMNCSASIFQVALGERDGSASLRSDGGDTAYSTTEGTGVDVRRLSDVLDYYEFPCVDLLKIDIEGDEEKVFRELSDSGWILKINRIVGEWHDPDRMYRMMELLRKTHHLTVCMHHWEHGYFEAVRNDQFKD